MATLFKKDEHKDVTWTTRDELSVLLVYFICQAGFYYSLPAAYGSNDNIPLFILAGIVIAAIGLGIYFPIRKALLRGEKWDAVERPIRILLTIIPLCLVIMAGVLIYINNGDNAAPIVIGTAVDIFILVWFVHRLKWIVEYENSQHNNDIKSV